MEVTQQDILALIGGCDREIPCRHIYFLLAIEILANTIRNDKTINGFQVGEYEIKQVLYADDFTLFMKDIDSINKLQDIFEEFE